MEVVEYKKCWALTQNPEFQESLQRLSSKFRGQITRKAMDLTRNPKPGGSKTPLKGYPGLNRVTAGDFRIIYAYDEAQVQLLTLRRRNEATYDDLDELEIVLLDEFKSIRGNGSGGFKIPEWEELAKTWAAPKPKAGVPLPNQIVEEMLKKIGVPVVHWAPLLAVTTEDELLDCQQIPGEFLERVIDEVFPKTVAAAPQDPLPIVVTADLVDPRAARISGPVEASNSVMREIGTATSSEGGGPRRPKPPVFVSTSMQEPMGPHRGNTSKGIGREAKYTVKLDNTIQLDYSDAAGDGALLTTDEHPELVALVNQAKRLGGNSQGGGGFLINEYRHVLVPTIRGPVLYAGVYTKDLEFKYKGTLVSPVAPPEILRGDFWPGPHVGIKYTLAAGATDVRYEAEASQGDRKRVCLSDFHSTGEMSGLLEVFRAIKPSGGAIYVNEARELFAPIENDGKYTHRYIGHLGDHPWFPEPA